MIRPVRSTFLPAVAAAFLLGVALSTAWKRWVEKKSKKDDDEAPPVLHEVDPVSNLQGSRPAPRRYGAAIKLYPEQYRRYRKLHDHVWDQVLDRMHRSNMRNFTIYYHAETNTLFQHFEWIGHWKCPTTMTKDEEQLLFAADMKAIAEDPITRKWWKECEPCQEPFSQWPKGSNLLSEGGEGPWWAPLECINYCGYWPIAYSNQQRDPDFVKLEEDKSS